MRKRVTRWISAIVIGTMLVSSVQVGTLKAEDNNAIIIEENEQPEVPQDTQSPSESEQNSTGEDALPEAPDTNTESGLDADPENMDSVDSEISEEVQVPEKIEQEEVSEDTVEIDAETAESDEIEAALNYLYINEAEQEEGAVQNIVLSWGNAENSIKNASIVVEDGNGNATSLEPSNRVDETFLYEHTFSKGIYHVSKVNIVTETSEKEFAMEELGVSANFGVGQSSNEGDKSDYMEMESVNTTGEIEADVEASVVSVDENGNIAEQDSIASAIGAQRAVKPSARVKARSAKASNVVVVLDPGHDSRHAGARGNGVAEEVAVLKIAQHCKAELEQYSGVTVYMTREDASCPFPNSTSNIDDIYKRTAWAKTKGADVFVSFHLNSAGASAKGAEVYYPSSSSAGQALAQQIQSQLVALGLYNRGAKGDASYAVVNSSMKNGFPGLIIEHAFVSNSSDANNYLKSDASLKKLGIADATGIAQYFGLSKGYWDGDYYYVNGQKVKGEYCIGGNWYYFAPDTGKVQLGLQKVGSRTVYYTREKGMIFGEYCIGEKWYYFDSANGNMKLGFQKVGSRTVYYTREEGMLFGKQIIDDKEYFFAGNGNLLLGFQTIDGKRVYYTREKGKVYGEHCVDGKWYYFAPDTGEVRLGWQNVGTRKVYYEEDEGMVFGEHCIDGKWYYFAVNGNLQLGFQKVGTREVYYDEEKGMLFGEQLIDDKWYYFAVNGNLQLGFQKVGTRMVYYTREEGMLFGKQIIDNKEYFFAVNGNLLLGFQTIDGKKVYYTREDGKVFGEYCIDDKWYYFAPGTGEVQLGFQKVGTREVYYDEEKGMVFGEHCIDGKWYYFAVNGNLQLGFQKVGSRTVYYTRKDGMLMGAQEIEGKRYYFNTNNGNMLRSQWHDGKYYGENGVEMEMTPIMGKSQTTIEQMVKYYERTGHTYPASIYSSKGAPTLKEFCRIYYEEAEKQGIRAEVAFTQAMKETGWLQFGGDVDPEQCNFAGIGAVGGGVGGATFRNVREGARAQIQHLFAYASDKGKNGLVEACIDPRFDLVSPKGGAVYVEILGKNENPIPGYGWATGSEYGIHISAMIKNLLSIK